MNEEEKFTGAFKTMRARYEEIPNLCSLWFCKGFKNSYSLTREQIKGKDYFVIKDENKKEIIFKIEIR